MDWSLAKLSECKISTTSLSIFSMLDILKMSLEGSVDATESVHCYHFVINTLRPIQNGRNFPDDFFKWILLNENAWISINISLKFVPRGPINKIPTLVQVMAWSRPGNKPLSEPMKVRLPTHMCVTRPQWVKNFTLVRNSLYWHVHNGTSQLIVSKCHSGKGSS